MRGFYEGAMFLYPETWGSQGPSYNVKKGILFDDIPQNLFPASDLGLKTVQIYNKKLHKELNGTSKKIDYMTNNLKEWLQKWIQNN